MHQHLRGRELSARTFAAMQLLPDPGRVDTRTGVPHPAKAGRGSGESSDDRAGRYISLEKLIDASRETYYEALRRSTEGWHEAEHDLAPWTEYFLGILLVAYKDFENRAGALGGRGSKRALVVTFIDSLLSDEFTVAAIRENAPGVSDGWISQVLGELKREGIVESLGTGRSARWKRLRRQA